MDSKVVTSAPTERIRPLLKEAGFSTFTGRKAWRRTSQAVQVIDFPSLNTYHASIIGTQTFSFGASVGIFYVPCTRVPWGERKVPTKPQEWECHLRRTLSKKIVQVELPRPDIWHLEPSGENLPAVIADVRRAVLEEGLPWLDRLAKLEEALSVVETQDEVFVNEGIAIELLGGQLHSLSRTRTAAALALELGQKERAIEAWRRLQSNSFYQKSPKQIEEAGSWMSWLEKQGKQEA